MPRRRLFRRHNLSTYLSFSLGLAALLGAVLIVLVVVFTDETAWGLLLALLPVVVGSWLAVRLTSKAFTEPLERLAQDTKRFSEGDYSVRFVTDGPQEVQLIAQTLNEMGDMVAETMEGLKTEEQRQIQFVSDVSHEIRTPLTAIRGAAETLLDGDVDPEDQQRFLTTICSEATRLTRLANDLLALQRIEGATGELPLRRVDLRSVANGVASILEPLLDERKVELVVTGYAPPVLGDPDRLHQVLSNLVDNASRFVGEGGHVRVELAGVGDQSVVAVIDDGPGLKMDDPSRLFDRFYRGDLSRTRASGGTGLGLAIVKAIVGAHGGTVEARSLPEGGACFTVRLPALPEAVSEPKDPFSF